MNILWSLKISPLLSIPIHICLWWLTKMKKNLHFQLLAHIVEEILLLIPVASGRNVQDLVRNFIINNWKNCFIRTGFILFLKSSVEVIQNEVVRLDFCLKNNFTASLVWVTTQKEMKPSCLCVYRKEMCKFFVETDYFRKFNYTKTVL